MSSTNVSEAQNSATSREIVNKVWNYAHVLRDDGVGYGDYVEQITYLIFLKMADERSAEGLNDVGAPEVLAAEIVEQLEAALNEFKQV